MCVEISHINLWDAFRKIICQTIVKRNIRRVGMVFPWNHKERGKPLFSQDLSVFVSFGSNVYPPSYAVIVSFVTVASTVVMMFPVWWCSWWKLLSQTQKHSFCASTTTLAGPASRVVPSGTDTKREQEESSGAHKCTNSNKTNKTVANTLKNLRLQALAAFLPLLLYLLSVSIVPDTDSCRQSYALHALSLCVCVCVFVPVCSRVHVVVCVCVEVRVSLGVKNLHVHKLSLQLNTHYFT